MATNPKPGNPGLTPEEAVYDIRERMVRMETVLTGVPHTEDKGLCGTVERAFTYIEANMKKIGHLEIKFWLLVGLLLGSGILGGLGISQLIAP